jgi:hypothetical protein
MVAVFRSLAEKYTTMVCTELLSLDGNGVLPADVLHRQSYNQMAAVFSPEHVKTSTLLQFHHSLHVSRLVSTSHACNS